MWGGDVGLSTTPPRLSPPLFGSYATDLVVCVALGCDMFDCVFPTRTAVRGGRGGADTHTHGYDPPPGWGPPTRDPHSISPQRFGSALVPWGSLQLKNKQFAKDFRPIDERCGCPTCQRHSRAYLHALLRSETAALHHLTIHNIAYQVGLGGPGGPGEGAGGSPQAPF